MISKLLLALRDDAHRVNLVTINGETRPQLGTPRTQDRERRADVYRQWGMPTRSPRETAPATIDEPLAQRSQTILSHELDPALRRRLNGGVGELTFSRKPQESDGNTCRVPGAGFGDQG